MAQRTGAHVLYTGTRFDSWYHLIPKNGQEQPLTTATGGVSENHWVWPHYKQKSTDRTKS